MELSSTPYEAEAVAAPHSGHELSRLRAEIELLRAERQSLLRAAGAAAVFVVALDAQALSEPTYKLADCLADALKALPEETLRHAIDAVCGDSAQGGKRQDDSSG